MINERVAGYQHIPAEKPASCFHDQVSDGPGRIIKEEVFNMAQDAVSGLEIVAQFVAYYTLHTDLFSV